METMANKAGSQAPFIIVFGGDAYLNKRTGRDLIRRALHNAKIERTVVVAGGGEETLTAVSTLLAQCSRVGGNLNQLARHFNSGGADTEQLRAKLLDELADLTAFRLNAEKVLGKLYGNAEAYRL